SRVHYPPVPGAAVPGSNGRSQLRAALPRQVDSRVLPRVVARVSFYAPVRTASVLPPGVMGDIRLLAFCERLFLLNQGRPDLILQPETIEELLKRGRAPADVFLFPQVDFREWIGAGIAGRLVALIPQTVGFVCYQHAMLAGCTDVQIPVQTSLLVGQEVE